MAAVAEGETDAAGIYWINDSILSLGLRFRHVFVRMPFKDVLH